MPKNTPTVKAVKERKKIEIIKNLTFRENKPTNQAEITTEKRALSLQKSKMKFKSSAVLGIKSLGVKPFRLIVTILLSAVAFAVFGLFDTLANFSTGNVMNNLLKNSDSTVAVYGQYVENKAHEDYYDVKFSANQLEEFSKETGFTIKGIYDDKVNSNGYIKNTYNISALTKSPTVSSSYYSKTVNGFIEFSQDEIKENGDIGDFGYKLIAGRYPELVYEYGGKMITNESLKEVAISTYLADSIIYFLNGNALHGHYIPSRADLLGKDVEIGGFFYTIVGLIDCGEIPEKYDVLLDSSNVLQSLKTVSENFNTFINSGAHKCLFFPEGRLAYQNKKTALPRILYGGNATWKATISMQSGNRSGESFIYPSKDYGKDNVLLFDKDYPLSGDLNLKDDEVLVHVDNIKTLFASQLSSLNSEQRTTLENNLFFLNYDPSIASIEEKQTKLDEIFTLIGKNVGERKVTVTITKTSSATLKNITKQVNVVGVYVNVDTSRGSPNPYLRFMMNDALLEHFNVYTNQGEFSRFIFSPNQSLTGTRKITNYMLSENGISLVWFSNSALEVVRLNESVVRQGADLFLYVALVLAAFSIFMLFNYIATSIVNKRQSIGILRGLGSGGKDILRMFLVESLIIALINAVLASIIAGIGCVLVNSYILNVMNIPIPFALFSIRQVLIIFGMSILTALASSALPIINISKEKPVDLIRRP